MFPLKAHSIRPHFSIGDRIYVKSKDEILKFLGPDQKRDGCLFMDQMFSYCGQMHHIKKIAYHIFDEYRSRLYKCRSPLYILDGLLCEGIGEAFHQKCDRSCYYFWHEDWLKIASTIHPPKAAEKHAYNARTNKESELSSKEIPFCQLTNLADLVQKNSRIGDLFQMRNKILRPWKKLLRYGWSRITRLFRSFKKHESLQKKIDITIHPGDIVKVKSKEEIRQFLDDHRTYRKLFFYG